jgi:large subunit ribosomal protein L30
MSSQIKITLLKSLNGRIPEHKRVAEALGLRKIRQTIVRPDTPIIRGMVNKIAYLIEVKTALSP